MRYKYEFIAKRIEEFINVNNWKEGRKLPSIKKLSSNYKTSINTIIKSLQVLESRNIIYMERNKGAFVKYKKDIFEIEYPNIQEEDDKKISVILSNERYDKSFSSAILHECLIPTQAIKKTTKQLANNFDNSHFALTPPPGLWQLREHISTLMQGRGVFIKPEEIIITTGDNATITLCVKQTLRNCKRIGVMEPSYFGYFQTIRELNVEPVLLPSKADGSLDISGTRILLETGSLAAIIVNPTLQNPTGHTMSNMERQELVENCTNNNCAIIEDDVFFDLYTGDESVHALKHFDTEGMVIYLSSFSKTFAPGLRVGWCVPGQLYQNLIEDLRIKNISVNSFGQHLASEILKNGTYEDHLLRVIPIFEHQKQVITSLIQLHFPVGTKISKPNGGFVYWIQLPEGSNPTHILERFAFQNLSITPSDIFGISPRNLYIRLCAGRLLTPELEQEIIALGKVASSCYKARVETPIIKRTAS